MITRLEIIQRQTFNYRLLHNDLHEGEGLIVPGKVPNSSNRVMRTFKEDRITATRYPVDFYRETFITNKQL